MKTKIIYILLFVLFTSTQSFARGGDLVNNGGGVAEKNFFYAYSKLSEYLNLCLKSEFCKLDKTQISIVEQISQGLSAEQKDSDQLQFLSEKKNPGEFIIDGDVKVAKTGHTIGSPIIINVDQIYTKNKEGFYIPTSVSEAVAILVHELGHHYGTYTHSELDLLGVRVALMLQHQTYTTPLLPWSQQISALFINTDLQTSFPEILVYVEDEVLDLSKEFKKEAFCPRFVLPIPVLPIPDITLSKSKPNGSLIHNVHWDKANNKEKEVQLSISGDVSHNCKDKNENIIFRNQDYSVEIKFTVTKGDNNKWSLNKDSVVLQQKHDPWWKIIKFGP